MKSPQNKKNILSCGQKSRQTSKMGFKPLLCNRSWRHHERYTNCRTAI